MIYCAELSLTDDGLQWLPMHCSILIMQCTELIVTQMGRKCYKNDVKVILCIALSPLFLNGCKNFVAVLQCIAVCPPPCRTLFSALRELYSILMMHCNELVLKQNVLAYLTYHPVHCSKIILPKMVFNSKENSVPILLMLYLKLVHTKNELRYL